MATKRQYKTGRGRVPVLDAKEIPELRQASTTLAGFFERKEELQRELEPIDLVLRDMAAKLLTLLSKHGDIRSFRDEYGNEWSVKHKGEVPAIIRKRPHES